MDKVIHISGIYKLGKITGSFAGNIEFEERESSIYYFWKLATSEGQLIASKSMNIAFERIPNDQDLHEFSIEHALRGIKNYRIGREIIILELNRCEQ